MISRERNQRSVALTSIKKPPVNRIPLIQLGVLVPFTLAILVGIDQARAMSAFWGGLLVVIPQFYLTVYAFRYMGARSAKQITESFYRGEAGKFILTFIGFGLIFLLFKNVDLPTLFAGYTLMLVLQWWLTAKALSKSY